MSRVISEESTETAATEEEHDIHHLTQAFELFSKETSRLEKAYKKLQTQFKKVNLELEESNKQLNHKVLELGELTHYLNSILGNMTQGLLFIGIDGRITTYNSRAEELLGKKQEEVIGKDYWSLFDDELFGFSIQNTLQTRQALPPTIITHSIEEEQKLELEVDSSFILHDQQSNQGLILLIRDITEIRRLQTLANHNDRLKELGEMAASIAHEIRNPLGGIRGFASLLKRDLSEQAEKQQMADYIVQGAARLDQLVSSVLHYARPMPLIMELTEVNQLLKDLCRLMRVDPQYAETFVIEEKLSERDIFVSLDVGSIKAAVLNLMVNAAQAMPEGGTIIVHASQEAEHAVIQIEDRGCGIPEENSEKIFSPFFTTKCQGNGFGLSEVHRTIQAHGGSIEFASSIGKGTTFTIKLPTRR